MVRRCKRTKLRRGFVKTTPAEEGKQRRARDAGMGYGGIDEQQGTAAAKLAGWCEIDGEAAGLCGGGRSIRRGEQQRTSSGVIGSEKTGLERRRCLALVVLGSAIFWNEQWR